MPRLTTGNMIGIVLFACFIVPAVFTPPFPLRRWREEQSQEMQAAARKWTGQFVAVPKESHSYLKDRFTPEQLLAFTHNVSGSYTNMATKGAKKV